MNWENTGEDAKGIDSVKGQSGPTCSAVAVPAESVSIERGTGGGGYIQPVCTCGWKGVYYFTKYATGNPQLLAERDAKQHAWAHDNAPGWFDYTAGWVQNPAHAEAVVR